jgi:ferredoxin
MRKMTDIEVAELYQRQLAKHRRMRKLDEDGLCVNCGKAKQVKCMLCDNCVKEYYEIKDR